VTLAVDVALGAIEVKFEVPPGVTVLFGPSGAGKSRTLACIGGLLKPERGRVALGDEVWYRDGATMVPIHRRRVAYVFQTLALFPHMTALDNVAYGIRDVSSKERLERAREMLAKMHVASLAERRPRTFSGGEAQRVAIARAFAMRPRVVLLDEPFSALDYGVKQELLREVAAEIGREKVPCIFVTHQPEDAEVLGDRVVFLEKGKVTRTAAMSESPFERK
jgi:molybdate transport system ATP-binding protein